MEIRTLEKQSITALTELFNKAFSDYFFSIKLTPENLKNKIVSENINLEKSVGIFLENKPVGFIFHAIRTVEGEKVAYNAGTGVIPEFRGNNATIKMYETILPVLKEQGVKKILLEVIDQNIQAIKSYKKVGFKNVTNLECFTGVVQNVGHDKKISIQILSVSEIKYLGKHWDWQPTWQHSFETVEQLENYKTFGVFSDSTLIAYAIINLENGRTVQFVIDKNHRRRGIGTTLFGHLAEISAKEISVMNVDGNDIGSIKFLKSLGLQHFLRQYKMELTIN